MLILWIVAATKGRKRKRHQDRSSSFPVWGSPWAAGLLAVIRSVLFTLGCSCYAERLVFTFSLRNIEYRFWKQALKAKQKTHTHTLTLTKSKTNSTTQVASWFIISMFFFFFAFSVNTSQMTLTFLELTIFSEPHIMPIWKTYRHSKWRTLELLMT